MSDAWDRTRSEHRAARAEAIAASALHLLGTHGASALTMAAIASEAGVSRATLYRYYPDVDAVMTGIAELVASHDRRLAEELSSLPDARARLDALVDLLVAASAEAHGPAVLHAALPPKARAVLEAHEAGVRALVVDALAEGVASGAFRSDLEPAVDGPLLVGLAAAAGPAGAERARSFVHRIIESPEHEENHDH